MVWTIRPWQDGIFLLTNAANGTSWHMNLNANDLTSMDSNITAPQSDQSFAFNQLDAVNDKCD